MTCTKCLRKKKLTDFSPSPRHRNGRFPWCKLCKTAYQTKYTNGVPKEIRSAKQAAWRAQRNADKEARKRYLKASSSYSLKSRYGITEHHTVELARHQGEVCAICGSPPNMSRKRGGLHVDHDHTTGVVRGLLCESCNLGLGFLKDSPTRLAAAIKYLECPPYSTVVFTDPLPKPTSEKGKLNPLKNESVKLTCIHCGKTFYRKTRDEFSNRSKGKEGPFCSQSCSGTWAGELLTATLVHGTTNGYTGHKCRCSKCRKAHTDAERDRRERRRNENAQL